MITVVITTYKREPVMILRALNSILEQTLKDIEIIIVDDSPNDYPLRNSVKEMIWEQQEAHSDVGIKYIQHAKNMGACAARNTGLAAAKGQYIAFLDDDDEWLPEKLRKQALLMKDPSVGLVYCGHYKMDDNKNSISLGDNKYLHGQIFHRLLYHNFIYSTSFPLIRTEVLKAVGGFDVLMKSAQDYDLWLRIAQKYNIECVEEPLVIYHVHAGEQITNNPQKKIDGLKRLNEKYKEYLDRESNLWWKRNIVITRYYAETGEKSKAICLWRRCAKRCPYKVIDNIKYLRIILKR